MTGRRLQGWRKLAGSSWSAPFDPQFFGDLDIDAANLLSYIEETRRRTGEHVTITHAVVKAVAVGLRAVPGLNVRLTRHREYPRESVDVLVIVATGEELTGVRIEAADTKSMSEIAAEVERRTALIRQGQDAEFGRTKRMLEVLPPSLLRQGLRLSAWLTSDRNVNLPRFGLPRQAFGGAMVSSIGMTGITHAYSPLASYYRVPLLVLVGAVQQKAVVVNDTIVARPILTMTATFDHRYTDGLQAAKFAQAASEYLSNPQATESRVIHLEGAATG